MTQHHRADHDQHMIAAAILIGLPALIALMLIMDDPAAKPRELDTAASATGGNVVAFPTSATSASETLTGSVDHKTLGETA